MPDPFPGSGIERQNGIGKKILAVAVSSPEIEGGRAGGDVDDPALLVEAHAAPRIGPADLLPGVRRPRIVSILSWSGDRMENPFDLASPHVERTNVARCGRVAFRDARPQDEQIAVNDARRRCGNEQSFRIPTQSLVKVDD